MRRNGLSGTTCHMQRLLCLLFIHGTLLDLWSFRLAACAELKSGYREFNDMLNADRFWSKYKQGQRSLAALEGDIRTNKHSHASAPSPSFANPAPFLFPVSPPAQAPVLFPISPPAEAPVLFPITPPGQAPVIFPVSPPAQAPASMPLFPSSPPLTVPYTPGPGVGTIPTGNCSINLTSIESVYYQTVTDCGNPVTNFIGVAICCPQLHSLFRIMEGKHLVATGNLGMNITEAASCFMEIDETLLMRGVNMTKLCGVQPSTLTAGSCPVSSTTDFHMLVNTTSLLQACQTIDPLKECVTKVCQNEIAKTTVQLSKGLPQAMDDCNSLALSWLTSQSYPDEANSNLRYLSSCSVNQDCPLAFGDTMPIASACHNLTTSNISTCCETVSEYMQSNLQKQMLITNQQAYTCANDLGLELQQQGVGIDVYTNCSVHLYDFSLQANGFEGCLLPSQPTDINVTTGRFRCDLNNGLFAQWPTALAPSPQPSAGVSYFEGLGRKTVVSVLTFFILLRCSP